MKLTYVLSTGNHQSVNECNVADIQTKHQNKNGSNAQTDVNSCSILQQPMSIYKWVVDLIYYL